MSKQNQNQLALFKLIAKKFDGKLNDTVAEVLGLSKSGAYSKMNGTNSLSYEEAIKLCQHFDVLLDKQIHNQSINTLPFPFYSDALRSKPENFVDYLKNILNHVTTVEGLTSVETTYLANEVPLFHMVQFPYLCAFKFFVWNKTNWHISTGFDQTIIENLVTNKELHKYKVELANHYIAAEGVEIWNQQMLNQTYSQLEYFIDIAKLTNIDIIGNILFDIQKLIGHLKTMCAHQAKMTFGKKEEGGKCKIYLNELCLNNEVIFISADQGNAVYFHFDAPNYLRSMEEKITGHMQNYLSDLKIVSSPISDPLLIKERSSFFHKLEKTHQFKAQKIVDSLKVV